MDMKENMIQRITPIHSRSSTPEYINRITPIQSRSVTPEPDSLPIIDIPQLEPDSLPIIDIPQLEPDSPIVDYIKNANPWITHLRICSELYGVKYKYASQCGEMRTLYYTKSNRDNEGRIIYPSKILMVGCPWDSNLIRKPWTGIAVRNTDGYSRNTLIL